MIMVDCRWCERHCVSLDAQSSSLLRESVGRVLWCTKLRNHVYGAFYWLPRPPQLHEVLVRWNQIAKSCHFHYTIHVCWYSKHVTICVVSLPTLRLLASCQSISSDYCCVYLSLNYSVITTVLSRNSAHERWMIVLTDSEFDTSIVFSLVGMRYWIGETGELFFSALILFIISYLSGLYRLWESDVIAIRL